MFRIKKIRFIRSIRPIVWQYSERLIAVMHKLAKMIFGVVNSQTGYNPDFAPLKTKSS